jgi:serine/threonine-protein kinase
MTQATELPPQIAGRYRPIRVIGRGGMGAVYEVEHLHTGQRLALKVLLARFGDSAEAIERFKREARASSRIQSDHVVRVTDADRAPELEDAPFLVMELLQGTDLERATAGHKVSPAEVVEWMRQIARALTKAHALGIVHRDLKPENLFLTTRDDGTPCVKILDFGIAKISEQGAVNTQSGHILGTPTFMAPEQASGVSSTITAKTDLYALGLIAFRWLVGRDYWNDGSVVQLIAQITIERMEPPSARGSSYGATFDEWFAKACARDPGARFASVNEQVEALAAALGLPASAVPLDTGRAAAVTPADLGSAPTLQATSDKIVRPSSETESAPTERAPEVVSQNAAPASPAIERAVSLSASAAAISNATPAPSRSRWPFVAAALGLVTLVAFAANMRVGGDTPDRATATSAITATAAPERAPASSTPREAISLTQAPSASAPASASAYSSAGASPSSSAAASAAASSAPNASASAASRAGAASIVPVARTGAPHPSASTAPAPSSRRGVLDDQL